MMAEILCSYERHYEPYDEDEYRDAGYGYNTYGYNNYRPPSASLKGKVEKKYWHTKQTVIQKLGKGQDCFVVAGDAEVDARLEVTAPVANYFKRGRHYIIFVFWVSVFGRT